MAANIFLDLPNGAKMPALGLGTWQAKDPIEIENAVNTALELGYRHIDTAFLYENEASIGKIVNQWLSAGKLKRGDLFITTKLPIQGLDPEKVEFFMKKSLENLQLDYVDLYLVHAPMGFKCDPVTMKPIMNEKGEFLAQEGKTDHAAVWKKMEEQVDAGRAKTIGLSNYSIQQIETVLKSARIKPANLQIEMHVYLQQRNLVNFCHKNNITVVAYSPLGSPGYNKYLTSRGQQPRNLPDILGDEVIAKIAKKHSKTAAQIALRFLIQLGVAVIPKSVTPKRIKENIDVFDFKLDDDDMAKLKALEVGQAARIFESKTFSSHPDFPFGTY